ncbi:retrotransposable element Tf2 [Tanacetum coccineum]
MQKIVKQFVRECDAFQREKPDLVAYPGLLQPFPIPKKIWSSISMDFIEKLPSSQGKTVILVVVDKLSKYAHFISMQHPFTTSTVAQVFLDNVYKLHGLPDSIMSDREKIFLSQFWQSLFKMLKKLKEWAMCLPMAEFWYNTNFHSAINTTPFQTVYGQTPPLHIPYVNGDSLVEKVDRTMQAREESLQMVKFYPKRAQNMMVSQANKHKSDRVFEVGMWVYLKLQPHRQVTIRKEHQHKLSSKYYGPSINLEKIGAVAYKLKLPPNSQVHLVFHVSQLKLCKGNSHKTRVLPHFGPNGLLLAEPVAILDRRLAKMNNRAVAYVLVKWSC